MRRFTIHSARSQPETNLESQIRARCQSLSREHDVTFEYDFATGAEGASFCPALLGTLDQVLMKAVTASPEGANIDVGTYWTRRGLEIEVSISGDHAPSEPMSAFRKESSSVGSGFSLSVYRARCPQGGTAWIIVQSHFARLRMVA